MSFQKKIFREYDIRGIFGDDYTADFAGILARAVAAYLRENMKPGKGRAAYRFAVGHDVRPSGEQLAPRFIDALVAEGFEVIDIGVVASPLVYFSTFHLDIDGAVSITGSHNPSEYNGFKICFGTSTLHGAQIQALLKLCESFKNQPPKPAGKKGSVTKADVSDAYIDDLKARVKIERKIKVVVDAGNATACIVAPKLLTALGCEVIPLFCDIDGTFPNHHPDPTVVENLVDLQKAVAEHKADLGIAYDGDSDRIGAVDENGRPIFGDELMVLFAREILARKPGATIISEVKSSHRLYQDIAKHGGRPIMWKTGHSLIKAKMKEEKAELAGEMSGHMFFADRYYGYDDAIYASIRLLEILSRTSKPFSSLLADLPATVNTPEIRIDCPDEIKFEVVRRVRDELSKRFKINDVDGVRIDTEVGWGLLRASNTQPVVVMRFEANTEKEMSVIRKIVEDAFETATKAVKAARHQ